MEHSKIASIGDKNITLGHNDKTSSAEFSMPQVEVLIEEICQPMDMDEEEVFDDAVLVPLRTLTDIDTVVISQRVLSAVAAVVVKPSAERLQARKPRVIPSSS
jgi:hypothetical protein